MGSRIKSKPTAASLIASRPDRPPIFIPASAATHEGFRAWVTSDEFPETLSVSYLNQKIWIDMSPEERGLFIPASAATYQGFRAWATSDEFPEMLRASYMNQGILIDMSPEELETHNKVKTTVVSTIDLLNRQLDLGELFSDRTLVTNSATGLATEPDGTFVTWASFESGRVWLVQRKDRPGQYVELAGTPDWVLEVVSRSSVPKDTKDLRALYHRAGIPEYWLIDARYAEVSFQILRRRRDRYVTVAPRDGWHRSHVFGRSFRLDRRKNRMGRWTYSLEVAPA